MAYPPAPGAPPPPAPTTPRPTNVFDKQRQQIGQQYNAQAQDQGDALQRRFAAMGTQNSGTAIKALQLQNDGINKQRDAAITAIDAPEQQQQFQSGESQLGRDFSSGEAQKQRDFQGNQFQQTFGLDQQTRLGQLQLAQNEDARNKLDQQFNMQTQLGQEGYGTNRRIVAGDLLNDSPENLSKFNPDGTYRNPDPILNEAMQRRQREMDKMKKGMAPNDQLKDPNSQGWWNPQNGKA